jgi:hypothetical protein
MGSPDDARWWAIRSSGNLKPATYRCPLCGKLLHAMSEHMLIAPEGASSRRRHAHTDCVAAARRAGKLPTYEEWRQTQPRNRLWGSKLVAAFSRRRGDRE